MSDNSVGRPTVMTQEVVNKLEYAFSIGCSDLEACFYADISKQTLYNYQAKNPEFIDRKERLKENPTFLARATLVNGVKSDPDLALKYLERKKKDEFSLRVENENKNTSTNQNTVYIEVKEKEEIEKAIDDIVNRD